MAEPFRVFFCWQSDLPSKTNRGLLQDALERAARAITRDPEIEVEAVVDRDTQDVPGAPDIASTILDKIQRADLVVADVSIVGRTQALGADKTRAMPNPNVLFELGYAVRSMSWDRVLAVANVHYGRVEDLPFDIRQRRVVTYTMAPGDAPAAERGRLVRVFQDAIGATPRREVRAVADLLAGLSPEGRTILLAAADDDKGLIRSIPVAGRSWPRILTTNRLLFEDGTAREAARWTAALSHLEAVGLLEKLGPESRGLRLTAAGYRAADDLRRLHGS